MTTTYNVVNILKTHNILPIEVRPGQKRAKMKQKKSKSGPRQIARKYRPSKDKKLIRDILSDKRDPSKLKKIDSLYHPCELRGDNMSYDMLMKHYEVLFDRYVNTNLLSGC